MNFFFLIQKNPELSQSNWDFSGKQFLFAFGLFQRNFLLWTAETLINSYCNDIWKNKNMIHENIKKKSIFV